MRKITTSEVKQIVSRGNQLLGFVASEVGGISFEPMNHGLSDFKVFDLEGTLQGRVFGKVDKNTGMVYVSWRPDPSKRNFAPKRSFKYDATDEVEDTLDFISWILSIKNDLEL